MDFETPYQLLVATILSAQCTDVRVNMITPELFLHFPTPRDMASGDILEIENLVKSCGFYRNKAKNIQGASIMIANDYNGVVPNNREDLERLPGVGRKTASVVLANVFNVPAIAVDTHVFRVSNRLGLASAKTVEQTEQQLMKNIDKSLWSDAHHWLIWHGRKVCVARKPKCEICNLNKYCKFFLANNK